MISRTLKYLVAALLLCAAQSPAADQARMSEAQVKVAYLYNFANFAEWPASAFAGPAAPLSICILGKSPFGDAADALSGRTVKNRKVQVRQISGIEEVGHCQLLFISPSEQGHLRRIVSELAGQPMLTVSDIKLFAQSGGMIALVNEGGRVRFEVNLANAEKSQVKLSSQLLRLATSVLR